jgi:hypothetical protein
VIGRLGIGDWENLLSSSSNLSIFAQLLFQSDFAVFLAVFTGFWVKFWHFHWGLNDKITNLF